MRAVRAGLVLAFLLALYPLAPAPAQESRSETMLVLGSASLESKPGRENVPAQERAFTEALREAVVQALVQTLGSRRLLTAMPLLAQDLLVNPSDYISGFQIESQAESEDRLFVLVSARVNTPALKRALSRLGLGQSIQTGLLSLIVLEVDEAEPYAWWSTPDAEAPVSLAYYALVNHLNDMGLTVLEPGTGAPDWAPLDLSPQEAATLGQHFKADLVLMGRIIEEGTPDGLLARSFCQIIDSASGEVLAGPIDIGGPLPPLPELSPGVLPGEEDDLLSQPWTEEDPAAFEDVWPSPEAPAKDLGYWEENEEAPSLEIAPETGPAVEAAPMMPPSPFFCPIPPEKRLVVVELSPQPVMPPMEAGEAGQRLATLLVYGLREAGLVLSAKPRAIEIRVQGIRRYRDLKVFLDTLSRFPDLIREVRQQSIRAGQATFTATALTTLQDLAEVVAVQDFPTFSVGEVLVDAQTIQIELVTK